MLWLRQGSCLRVLRRVVFLFYSGIKHARGLLSMRFLMPVYIRKDILEVIMKRNGRVNGKDFPQIVEELCMPLDEALFKTSFDGTSYVPVEVYEGRFNDVVGRENYDLQYPELKVSDVGLDVKVMALCRLCIYDAAGDLVSETSKWGAANLMVSNTGREEKFNTTVQQAQSYALSAVIKTFGVGMAQVREAKQQRKNADVNGRGSQKAQEPLTQGADSGEKPGETRVYDIRLVSIPSVKGTRYFAECEDLGSGQRYELVMKNLNLQEAVKTINRTASAFISACKPGVKLRIRGYTSVYQGKLQLNLVGFPLGGAS